MVGFLVINSRNFFPPLKGGEPKLYTYIYIHMIFLPACRGCENFSHASLTDLYFQYSTQNYVLGELQASLVSRSYHFADVKSFFKASACPYTCVQAANQRNAGMIKSNLVHKKSSIHHGFRRRSMSFELSLVFDNDANNTGVWF